VCSPQGFFLIEIKSHPGRLFGDAGAWTWERDGRLSTMDNPVILANTKAKKLRSLLQRQKACRKKGQLPFLEALVFCSAEDVRCDFQGAARFRVCLRDQEGSPAARPGIMGAIQRRDCPGLDPTPKGVCDRPTSRMISQAMEQAGIRPSQRHRKVSDYELGDLIEEGPGYQDWQASHTRLQGVERRVRIYTVRTGATEEERRTIARAADREAQLLETLQHPGILRREGFTEHELGVALIFEHHRAAMRLDHYLAQRQDELGVDRQLALLRQIADVIRFAHDKKVVHRALSPRSILVIEPDAEHPRIKIFNWQMGYRTGSSTSGVSREVTATSHAEHLVEDTSTAYMAPEALSEADHAGEHLDVFSLGAIAYHLFSGQPPAINGLELSNKLRETKGLQISSVLNGAGEYLQFLIQYSTHPDVANRIDSVADFLSCLGEVEDELTTPDHEFDGDPTLAQKGNVLPGNFTVVDRLGQGACSVALLVERDGEKSVLKVASTPEHNPRLKDEGEVLQHLDHQHIVKYFNTLEIGDRTCVRMRRAGQETLGQKLRHEGRLHVDLLQRFGADLLGVVSYLEEQGQPHRDIKPDNIGVGPVGRGSTLHLVLFDFSLSRTPVDNIRAGTTGYLDPMLPLRRRWDLHAERYAAAVTLYELAAGPNTLPKWGDGVSDPSHLDCEVTIEADLFEAGLRESLTEFFAKALRRDPVERFDNADDMLQAWRRCFDGIEQPGAYLDPNNDEDNLRELLAEATLDTPIAELGLGTRMLNALDRANILTVEDLLTVPVRRLRRLRGVGNKTRREIVLAVRMLRERLGAPVPVDMPSDDAESESHADAVDAGNLSVDLLVQRLMRTGAREGEVAQRTRQLLLGLDAELTDMWPTQADIARCVDVTRGRVGQIVGKLQQGWSREKAMTQLRADIVDMLQAAGGVMSIDELSAAVLTARGSVQDDPQRTRLATAAARAAVEVERTIGEPRFIMRRDNDLVLIATHSDLAGYASRLGQRADQLADEDPLASPTRVLEKLRQVAPPKAASGLSDARLVRLAAAASAHAAVSSRQELYPRGMDAARAIKLSQGALLGTQRLEMDQIRDRVSSRYPEAAPLPGRPALDAVFQSMGLDLDWDTTANQGRGAYVNRLRDATTPPSSSVAPLSRRSTANGASAAGEITPEIADARQFEERLQRSLKDGSFLALLTPPRHYQRACEELCHRFPVQLLDIESVFIKALREVAEKARVNWDLVLKTDATPHQGDWDKLMLLVGRAMPLIEAQVLASDRTLLMIYPGLLARYDRMDLLERLRDQVGRRDGIPGLWLLLPGQHQALIDGKAVPIFSPGQRVDIPENWLRNVHRGRTFDVK
ncbi:MAG: BREX system serine/threonine kinase PglW, partial [Candidatus Tectomicrobia bacterium]|nr:BREX system serine/threonine kinase PglW [Candidatus Tectomicrobia bacterium]